MTPPSIPIVPEAFGEERAIQFRCRKGIACWNACCSNIDIPLTPYDVLRLKARLGIDSGEFLRRFTLPFEMEKDGLAGVRLKPVEGGTACQFMEAEGCAVYADRPTACRYYPLALLSMRREGESVARDSYALVKEPHCLGHLEPRTLTVGEYRREQGLWRYDELARGWRELVLKKKSAGPAVGKTPLASRQLFFMACYDLDRFRAFVSSEGFVRLYDLPADERQRLSSDDEALLAFAFRFLRQVLFGEATIAVREDEARARLERFRAKAEQRAREAAEQRAADEDEGYQPLD